MGIGSLHFVSVDMPPDEWANYMVREYNALADRCEAAEARVAELEEGQFAEMEERRCSAHHETRQDCPSCPDEEFA